MPRFDKEGFNPEKRINNDSRDRFVPEDEDYNTLSRNDEIIDNQHTDFDLDAFMREINEPKRSSRQSEDDFIPAVYVDRDAQRRQLNEENAHQRRNAPSKSNKPKKRSSAGGKAKNVFRAVVALILVLVIGAGCIVGSAMGKINYDDNRKNQYVDRAELAHSASVTNILLLGVDARDPKDDSASRADSMMLISIDKAHNCIKMISFLRDTWVYIPSADKKQRLNAACSYDGYNGVVDTIEYNFGIDIDGYVVADFEMFKVLVDSIGGVEVEVTEKEAKEVTSHKKRYGNVKLDAGKYKLTGEQALAYCRIRKIDSDGARANRQKTVLNALFKKMKASGAIDTVKVVNQLAGYVYTGYEKKELIEIGNKALKDGWLGYEVKSNNVPKPENAKGGQNFSVAPNNWIWLADIPKDAYELQTQIYGKSNIKLSENRPDYIAMGK